MRRLSRRDLLTAALGATAVSDLEVSELAAQSPATALLADPIYKQHETGAGHPEQPARYDAAIGALDAAGLSAKMRRLQPRDATEDELELCHTAEYIRIVQRDARLGRRDLSTGDTTMGPHSLDVALKATGGVLNAVDAVVGGKARNAFCIVRPPGHHARPAQGMGFCFFNNVAIAARYAQKQHGIGRVLIADWDVHHGNGTQDIFYRDGSVLFFSTHQSPWYPGTGDADERGEGRGEGCIMNFPFAAGAGKREIGGVFRENLRRAADTFKPELVFISAGFDSRIGDPLGGFTLTDADFAELTNVMLEIAGTHASGRVVSVLEGGYSLTGLASGVAAHVKTLMG